MDDFSWLAFIRVEFKGPDSINVSKECISQFLSLLIQQDRRGCEVKRILGLKDILAPLLYSNGLSHMM